MKNKVLAARRALRRERIDTKKKDNAERNFLKLKYEDSLRHSLPVPGIKSRLATSIALSYFCRRKNVIKLLLTLSRKGRAFIISQIGLPGFLVEKKTYERILSLTEWISRLRISNTFRQEV